MQKFQANLNYFFKMPLQTSEAALSSALLSGRISYFEDITFSQSGIGL
jgi:hypothetical protein